MSITIPPLVCETPPPIDELEDISGDDDISSGANGSQFEHFEAETPSSSPNYHHCTHNSIFSTDSIPVIEDISSELNEINAELIEQTIAAVLVEGPISSSSDAFNGMICQNEIEILESNRISPKRDSFSSLDVMDYSIDLTSTCDNNVSNQSVCIKTQNLESRKTDNSHFEQQRWIENSILVNDETNADDRRENLNITFVDLDEHISNDYNLNERTTNTDENPTSEIESDEALTKTLTTVQYTVQSKKVNRDEKTLNEKFDADFSQFDSSKNNRSVFSSTIVTSDPIESVQTFEISTTGVYTEDATNVVSIKNSDNEDDEFGDFSSFSPPTIAATDQVSMINSNSSYSSSKDDTANRSETPIRLSKIKLLKTDNLNDSIIVFDESNGEIMTNKFQQTTISKNTKNNLDEILSTLFPTNMTDIDPENDLKNNVKCLSTNGKFQFMNKLTIHLKNVENAKALKYQWAKSAAKTFLIKSLGIDSRNILYGEKWNSSAPKFANLGIGPLEPMKLNTTTSSDISDNRSTFKTAADVPAAQFDWNSSGLINPLDALHAHTLLLDLEQLVVVANLDKRNLNSSSSPASKCIQKKDDNTECLANSVLKYQTASTLKLPEIDSIGTILPKSTSSPSLIQKNGLNHRRIMNDDNKRIRTNHSKFVSGMHSIIIDQSNKQQMVMGNSNQMTFDEYFRSRKSWHEERNEIPLESPKQCNNECQKTEEPAANTISETPKIISTICSPIVPELESNQPNKSNVPNAVFDLNYNSNIESLQTSDSYNVPGSSGTMKETHIFTLNKLQPETDAELSVDSNSVDKKHSSEETERVVIINDNVVKKEYRDIEYDPKKVISLDEFSDFQFVNTTTNIAMEQITLEQGHNPSIELESNAVINNNSESNSDIVNTMSNCNGIEKSYAINVLNSLTIKIDEPKNDNYNNQIENLKQFDEPIFVNNTNLHTDISVCTSAEIQPTTSETYTDKNKMILNAPTMMLSNILKPQLVSIVKPTVGTSIKSSPNIEWPGPGIDTEQLMQLEQRFCAQSQMNGAMHLENGNNTVKNSSEKYSEDDEWTEFVSVEQPQTPITNILSKNLLKQQNDEDDWTEFVSSTVPMNIKRTTSNTNDIDSANDSIITSWNCDEMSISMADIKPKSMYNVSKNQRTNYMVPSHSETPSMISTLPDLRFAAPKSLVHMPNSSFMKK